MAFKKGKLPVKVLTGLVLFSVFMIGLFWLNMFAFRERFMPAPVQWLDNIIYDIAVSTFGGPDADPRISIAAIDEYSIGKFGWPFPRKYHAELIKRLKELGAKTVVFDVMFINPDERGPEGDRAIAEATLKAGNVVHAGLIQVSNTSGGRIYSFQYPVGDIWKDAWLVANPNVDDVIDSDGKVRRVMLYDKRAFYSKGAGTSCMAECDSEYVASLSLAAYASYNGIKINKAIAEVGPDPVRWLFLTGPQPYPANPGRENKLNEEFIDSVYPHISFADILDGQLSDWQKERIKGGIVLVGSTALGNYDHYPSAFGKRMPGVELHANSLDNLLRTGFMSELSFFVAFTAMLLFIWFPVLFFRSSIYLSGAVTAVLLFAWTLAYVILSVSGYKTDYVMPASGLVISFAFLTIYRVVVEGQEKRWIKSTFGQYLSPAVVDVLVKDPGKLKLGGEKRDMTVFFLDIAKFTSISEKLTPEELTDMLNKLLTALTNVIMENDGVVDKYIGDCIMAFWNAPLDDPGHRVKGCIAAAKCQEAMQKLTEEYFNAMPIKPQARIGLNSGFMVVGNMGSEKRFSYTVIGDEVNLASRLEGANKFFGSKIMVSEACYAGARDVVAARELGRVRVVGKNIPIKVYELFGLKETLPAEKNELLKVYGEGVALFGARDFAGAAAKFEAALKLSPDDKVSDFYIKQCEQNIKTPPPAEWDGVFNLTSK